MDEVTVPAGEVPVVPPVVVPPEAVQVPLAIPAPVVYPKPVPSGNDYFDSIQNVLHDKGLDPAKFTQEYSANGTVSPESRAELVAAMGEAQVQLIEKGMATEVQKLSTAQAAADQVVFDSIGLPGYADGKTAFGVIADWSRANMSAAETAEYNEMLSKGGVQATLAVKALKERYMADANYTVPANLVAGTSIPASQGMEPISRSTYTAELRKANNARDTAAIKKLNDRATFTMTHHKDAWRP